jgi:hypothetical protein
VLTHEIGAHACSDCDSRHGAGDSIKQKNRDDNNCDFIADVAVVVLERPCSTQTTCWRSSATPLCFQASVAD